MTIQVPDNSLWQYIERDHIDSDIKKSQWNKFVEQNQDEFAEKVSELAEEMWQNYITGGDKW